MDMTFIITDKDRKELGALEYTDELDLEMNQDDSKANDFELTVARTSGSLQHISVGGFFYAPGTPYGGCIEETDSSSDDDEIVFRGFNWMGFLSADVIEPPAGQDYWTYTGEANEGIRQMLGESLGGMFDVSEEDSGIQISGYQVRYYSKLKALQDMLEKNGARMSIETVQTEQGFKIVLAAVAIQNLCEEVTYNEDNKINIRIDDMKWGINHLICLGKGELKDRTVVHLYLGPDGQVRDTQFYQGFRERKEVFDYSSAQSEEDLREKGAEKLLDLANYKKMELTVDDMDLDIGDIVGGIDKDTGATIQKPIVRKILKMKKGDVEIEYKTEGEN